MKKIFYFQVSLTFFLCLFLFTGCNKNLIPSTNVAATLENKSVVNFLKVYKDALEKRSVESVMDLVAPDFDDNAGSTDPKQRLNYLGLKEKLEKYFAQVREINVGLFIQNIKKLKDGTYEVVFFYNNQSLVDMPKQEEWIASKDVSKMVIRKRPHRKEPYNYEILKGL